MLKGEGRQSEHVEGAFSSKCQQHSDDQGGDTVGSRADCGGRKEDLHSGLLFLPPASPSTTTLYNL